jgi:hypothetical protein
LIAALVERTPVGGGVVVETGEIVEFEDLLEGDDWTSCGEIGGLV